MSKRVLDVGNCDMDHGNIRGMLEERFRAAVDRAHGPDDALAALRAAPYDLVLVNRLMDRDGSEGLEVLRRIQADPALAGVPVMIITNIPEHEAAAVSAGARPGFGKLALNAPQTHARLREYLA
jgi:CheY-like chemotaxis protein